MIRLINPSIHPPPKDLTNTGAGEPQFHTVGLVDDRILRASGTCRLTSIRKKLTLIVARRTLVEANRSLADFMLVSSLARSRALIAAIKEGRVSS